MSFRSMKLTALKSTFKPLVLLVLFFSASGIPFKAESAFGDVSVEQNNISASQQTTGTSTTPYSYSCVIGQQMTSFSFWTRAGSGSRSFALAVNGVQQGATTTITTTQAYAVFSNLAVPCLTGSWTFTFPISANEYYSYRTQDDVYGDYVLKNTSGTLYGYRHRATFTLPLTVSTSSSEIDMASTTLALEVISTQFLFYSLIMIVISAIALIFTIRKR